MASPSCNTNTYYGSSTMSEIDEGTMKGYQHLQSTTCLPQHLATMTAEPSMFSTDHLPYNHPMHPRCAYFDSSFAIPSAPNYPDVHCPNQDSTTRPSIDESRTAEAPLMDYFSPGDNPVCPNSSTCHSSPQTASQPKVRGSGYAKRNPTHSHGRTRKQKPKKTQGPFECHWEHCKRREPFSGKPALLRHIETQHIAPGSFVCPSCEMVFNRKDNMTEHLGRVHWERV